MALCRCKEKHHNPKGRKEDYVTCVRPIGYRETSSICGRTDCRNPGLIWLTEAENKLYLEGETVFTYATAVSKVEVEKKS